jgi:hypothetical protein
MVGESLSYQMEHFPNKVYALSSSLGPSHGTGVGMTLSFFRRVPIPYDGVLPRNPVDPLDPPLLRKTFRRALPILPVFSIEVTVTVG